MTYTFYIGQRVRHSTEGWTGEITSCVPGDGITPWYFVAWDTGGETRETERTLVAEWTPPGIRPKVPFGTKPGPRAT